MRLLIYNENYPHLENLMGNGFVHIRVKEYAKHHDVQVFSYFHEARKIVYEGVNIETFDDVDKIVEATKAYKPDRILVHFYQPWMLERVFKKLDIPVVIWVHGFEALGWYRRLFNYKWYSPYLLRFIYKNTLQQLDFRGLIKHANNSDKVQFVFVSDWMKRVTETDTLCQIKHSHTIPNPIETNMFAYREKTSEDRKKILLLRNFNTYKYANDISARAILHLSKKNFFNDLSFRIIGKGQLFDKILDPIKHFPNVDITNGAVLQSKIPELHAGYGVFLCPTRQDAQGVSMCEAMSSGLVPVTSDNTAIPEFVSDRSTGFLTHNYKQVADAIEEMYMNPDLFLKMSKQAADSMRAQCSISSVINQELEVIK